MDINLTNKDGVKLNTAGKYCAEDINVIPQLDTTTVTPAKGQQVIQPSNNKIGFSSVTVEAIPDDYVIPSGTQQITENGTYDVSGKANAVVNVESQAKEEQEKSITITENGSFTVTPDAGKTLSSVTGTVNVPTSGGGGAELNIAYGDTAPTDTSKLWIKSAKPANIEFAYLASGAPLNYYALLTALPYRMRHQPVSMLGTKIYVFGSSAYPKKNIYVFDVVTNTVSTFEQAFDYSLDEGQAVTIGDKIYVLSCNKSSSGYYMYEYNPETNVMTQQKYFTAGGSSAMIAFENQIYTIGGTATNDYPHKFVYRYDPIAKAIITVGTMPNSLHKACSVSYGRYIYAFGGRSYQNSKYVSQLKVIRINVDTSEIVELDAAFTEEVYDMVAIKLGKDIYLMGSYGQSSSVYHFDAETETLNPTPLPNVGFINQTGVRGVQYGNVLYCMGGGLNSAASNAGIGKFVGTIDLNQGKILIHEGEGEYYFDALSAPTKVEIGVRNVYIGNSNNEAKYLDAFIYKNSKWINVNTGKQSFSITASLTNVSANSGNATSVPEGGGVVLVYTANDGYELPDSVSVTGATGSWSKSSGTLTLTEATGNVTFSIVGVSVSTLSTPTISHVSGTTIQVDSIDDNATTIGVYADSNKIGEATKS